MEAPAPVEARVALNRVAAAARSPGVAVRNPATPAALNREVVSQEAEGITRAAEVLAPIQAHRVPARPARPARPVTRALLALQAPLDRPAVQPLLPNKKAQMALKGSGGFRTAASLQNSLQLL